MYLKLSHAAIADMNDRQMMHIAAYVAIHGHLLNKKNPARKNKTKTEP
jgi:hypothetical protein